MKIRWSFYFEEGSLAVDVLNEAEDQRISNAINNSDELLFAPGQGRDAYINLLMVKCIVREEVPEVIEEAKPLAE